MINDKSSLPHSAFSFGSKNSDREAGGREGTRSEGRRREGRREGGRSDGGGEMVGGEKEGGEMEEGRWRRRDATGRGRGFTGSPGIDRQNDILEVRCQSENNTHPVMKNQPLQMLYGG